MDKCLCSIHANKKNFICIYDNHEAINKHFNWKSVKQINTNQKYLFYFHFALESYHKNSLKIADTKCGM